MKFANIISEAGLDIHNYPNLSGLEVEAFDRKYRKITNNLTFATPIFSETRLERFKNFLEKYENNADFKLNQLRINDDSIIIYSSIGVRVFLR